MYSLCTKRGQIVNLLARNLRVHVELSDRAILRGACRNERAGTQYIWQAYVVFFRSCPAATSTRATTLGR